MDTTRATAVSLSKRLCRPVPVLAAVLAAGLATSAIAQQGATRTKDINAIVFQERVKAAVDGRVKGYAFVIADRNGIEVKVSGGMAQAPGDGDIAMKTFIPSGTGSVAKVISGVALLHLLEQRKVMNASVQRQLDVPIWAHLPDGWRLAYRGRNLERITFRQLLQHKSGIRIGDGGVPDDWPGIKISYVLDQGVNADNIGGRSYNNFNFTLLLYLIPALAYPNQVGEIETENADLSEHDYAKTITPAYGALYEKYLREVIFPKTAAPIQPTCRPLDEIASGRYAKHYANRNATRGDTINSTFCRSQGAWYYSAQDLAQFARGFALTNNLLSAGTRNALYNPADSGERLVYSRIISNAGFQRDIGQGNFAYHGGTQSGYRAALVRLPFGYVGTGMTNSGELSSERLAQIILDAFYDATSDVALSRAHHGLTPARYQQMVSEFEESGSMVDWVDFYNVGGKTFVNLILRPRRSDWLLRHGLTGAQYQRLYDRHVKNGRFKLRQVDSYLQDGQVAYAALLVAGSSANMPAYHGVDAATHNRKFRDLTSRGFVPVNISVVSVNGGPRYTAFYEKRNTRGLWVKSLLDGRGYQNAVDARRRDKMELAYVNTYRHDGKLRYSVIFYGNINKPQVLRHGMGPRKYQDEFDTHVGNGFGLKMITGGGHAGKHRYAAVWQR